MDTSAYLIRQGWLGYGHALNPTGHGITKPLLISQKTNVLGLGKRKNDAHADQWWARAFDTTLKRLNVSQDEATGMTKEVTLGSNFQPLGGVIHGGATRYFANSLYCHFVQGEGLKGTQTPQGVEQAQTSLCLDLRGAENEAEPTGKEERRRRKKRKMKERTKRTPSPLGQRDVLAASQDEARGKAVSKDKNRKRRERGDEVETQEGRKSKKKRTCIQGTKASKEVDAACQSPKRVIKHDDPLIESRKGRNRKKRRLELDTI